MALKVIRDTGGNRPGLTARTDGDTQKQGARDVLPRSGTRRRQVYDALVEAGGFGATDDELLFILEGTGSWSYSTMGPRRRELVSAGLVRDSGRRRKGRAGSDQTVWVIA